MKTKKKQDAASAAHTKLLASERQKAELEEVLRQKEKRIIELESKVEGLGKELDGALQFQSSLGHLQPSISGIEERLKTLEYAYNKINERMLQIVQKIHEMHHSYENTSLTEIVKRSLRRYQGERTSLE
jgi:predicted  nucleic acid-binding Zn-ribbon protein